MNDKHVISHRPSQAHGMLVSLKTSAKKRCAGGVAACCIPVTQFVGSGLYNLPFVVDDRPLVSRRVRFLLVVPDNEDHPEAGNFVDRHDHLKQALHPVVREDNRGEACD